MSIEEIASKSVASQHPKELEQLLRAVSGIDINNVLEIGVHHGHSMQVWDWAFNPEFLTGVDIVDHVEIPEYKEKLIVGDSTALPILDAVMTATRSTPEIPNIDFLFIDGNHLEDFVRFDWKMYSRLVREGGVIAFHDVWLKDHELVGVYKVWDTLKLAHNYQEIHFEGGTGVGVIFK